MGEGYGHDWEKWDQKHPWQRSEKGILYKGEPTGLENASYGNFYPFRSPKGRWMAFHNKYYSDIRIIDLKTHEVIIDQFYKTPTYYNSHTNYSIYVPGYMPVKSLNKERNYYHFFNDYDLDENKYWDDFEDTIGYLPIAFNAWTIWACDFEFYVDVLDLRQIDDGILKLYNGKQTSFVTPRGMGKVRNYVNVQLEPTDDGDTDLVPKSWDIPYIEEKTRFRCYNDKDGFNFHDMYKPDEPFTTYDETPGVKNERERNERKSERQAKAAQQNQSGTEPESSSPGNEEPGIRRDGETSGNVP